MNETSSTFIDLFLSAMAAGKPDRPMIFFDNDIWSYQRVSRTAMAVAQQLTDLGLNRGDRVVTVMPSTPDLVALQLAIAAMGGSFVPLIPESTTDEFEYSLAHCKPVGLIVDRAVWPLIEKSAHHARWVMLTGDDELITAHGQGLHRLNLTPGRGEIGELVARCGPDDELTVMYTSGSSGRPKGVVLPHCAGVAVGLLASRRLALRSEDVILVVLPLHHFGGLKMLSYALASGGALMMQARFSRTRFWRDVRFSGATAGILMPAMMSMLLTNDVDDADRKHSLRTVISHVVNRQFEDRFGVEVVTTWGQSELAGTATLMRLGETDKPMGYVGTALDARIEIEPRNEEGKAQPVGQSGEIFCRHPWTMRGYLNEERDGARSVVDGWVATGDLGHLDDRGRLFYDGRKKNMIKRSGENVSGAEVEAILQQHPAVSECIAFGVPDPIRTEELKVVLTLRPGSTASEAELASWCAERLARFKVPRYIEIRDVLPRLATMKPDRVRLTREHDPSRTWDRER